LVKAEKNISIWKNWWFRRKYLRNCK